MESHNYRFAFAYDGTAFKGWQRLSGKARTVQGVIETALSRIVGTTVEIAGSGRTDSGVHAAGQVANARLPAIPDLERFLKRLDAELPEDIACLGVERAAANFHARFSAVEKTYRYLVHDGKRRDPFSTRYAHHLTERLDLDAMRAAVAELVGKRDFTSLTNLKPGDKSFVRDLRSIAVTRDGDFVSMEFVADGFLYNQVRIMAGALIEAGLGSLTPDRLRRVVDARDRSQAPGAAPAKGLRLESVRY